MPKEEFFTDHRSRAGILSCISACILSCVLPCSALESAVDIKKTHISIDTKGFAKNLHRQIEKKQPLDPGDEIINLSGRPECARITFDDHKVDDDNNYGVSHLIVYPLKAYTELYAHDKDRKKSFAEKISTLKKIFATRSTKGVAEIPIFPQSDAAQVFHNQDRCLKFKQGSGVSFISSYSNGDPPLTNDSQFYCFQGLTKDGRFYISFFSPIKSVGIPQNAPIDKGIAYLAKLSRSKFEPNLDSLDRMMQSIDIK